MDMPCLRILGGTNQLLMKDCVRPVLYSGSEGMYKWDKQIVRRHRKDLMVYDIHTS